MIMNIKIQNIIDIIENFQNLWNLVNVFIKNIYLSVFFMNFQCLMGLRKLRCDIFNGAPKDVFA
jgi:hypothetical protein